MAADPLGEQAGVIERPDRGAIDRVTFYKRDLITTDLICCDIELRGQEPVTWHEEMKGWDAAIDWLAELPGFGGDWFQIVSQPPFDPVPYVAFERAG